VVRTLHDIDRVNKEADKDSTYECCHAVKTGNICTANVLVFFFMYFELFYTLTK